MSAPQVHDYLTQVFAFSNTEGLPRITQSRVASILEVAQSTISRFLSRPKSGVVKSHFAEKFPHEVELWPKDGEKINRFLTHLDVRVFLGLPLPLPVNPPLPRVPRPRPADVAPIVIGYRGHESAKDGAGMLYDHMTIQQRTGHPTRVSYAQDPDIAYLAGDQFRAALGNHPSNLPHGGQPPAIDEAHAGGLLVIPGRVRKKEYEPLRKAHEEDIINEALRRGQPIVAICAGSWRVWEACGGDTMEVEDHSYGGGMLRLDRVAGTRVTHNKAIHGLELETDAMITTILGDEAPTQVNSVHWRAVDPATTPERLRVVGWSTDDPSIVVKTRQSILMQPQVHTPEAFESTHGAPIMAFQWHVEGGDSPALHFMALAGDAYLAKQRVLEEFKASL